MPDGSDIDALKAALAASEAKAGEAEARAANAEAQVSDAEAQIAALKLMIEKLRRALFGQRSERKQRLLDQMELQLDELEANATEDELAAEQAAAGTQKCDRRSTPKAYDQAHREKRAVRRPRRGRARMGPHRQPHRDLQDERCRALRLAQGHARENRRRPPQQPHRRTSLLELHPAVKLKAGRLSRTALMSFVKPRDERRHRPPCSDRFSMDVRISVEARPGTLLNKL